MSSFDKLFRPAGPLGGQQLSAKQLREIAADAGAAQANDIPGGGFTRTQSGTVYDVPEAAATTFSGARAYSTDTQALTDSVITGANYNIITFNTVRYDIGGYCDLTTYPSRVTVPEDGYYHVGVNVVTSPSVSPYHFKSSAIYLLSYTPSGTPYQRACVVRSYIPTDAFFDNHYAVMMCGADLYLPANHYFQVGVEVNGSSGSIPGLANTYPEIWVHKIG